MAAKDIEGAPPEAVSETKVVLVAENIGDIYGCLAEDLNPFTVEGVILRVGAVYRFDLNDFRIIGTSWTYINQNSEPAQGPAVYQTYQEYEPASAEGVNDELFANFQASLPSERPPSLCPYEELPRSVLLEWYSPPNKNSDLPRLPMKFEERPARSIDAPTVVQPMFSMGAAYEASSKNIEEEENHEPVPEEKNPDPALEIPFSGTKWMIGNLLMNDIGRSEGEGGVLFTFKGSFWNNSISQRSIIWIRTSAANQSYALWKQQKGDPRRGPMGPDTSLFQELSSFMATDTDGKLKLLKSPMAVLVKAECKYEPDKTYKTSIRFSNLIVISRVILGSVLNDTNYGKRLRYRYFIGDNILGEQMWNTETNSIDYPPSLIRSIQKKHAEDFTIWQTHLHPFVKSSQYWDVVRRNDKSFLEEKNPPEGKAPIRIYEYSSNPYCLGISTSVKVMGPFSSNDVKDVEIDKDIDYTKKKDFRPSVDVFNK